MVGPREELIKVAIGRVVFRAKPASDHPRLQEWETADVVVFVQADTEAEAVARAREKLVGERWEPLEQQGCDRLIADRVRAEGGDVLAAYEEAEGSGAAIRIFSRHWPGDGSTPMLPLRISEDFMDAVVEGAGGVRLAAEGEGRTADYRVRDWLFELKDLQEEGLLQQSRQKKILNLFQPYLDEGEINALDPSLLSEAERRKFDDMLGSPIQGQVKSASKQIRATKERLGEPDLRGGLIYLNTGYLSLQLDGLGPMVERYVRKDTTQIEATFCVSIWVATNGFDTQVLYKAHPDAPTEPVIEALKKSFASEFEAMMTSLVRGELPEEAERARPLAPIAVGGEDGELVWDPGELEGSWKKR